MDRLDMKLRVTNKQRYALGRRGHVFPPAETVEVEVYSDLAYQEIASSRYLDVEVVNAPAVPEPASEPEPAVTEVDEDTEELTHLGGGWYELPNGQTIRGRDAAEAALAEG